MVVVTVLHGTLRKADVNKITVTEIIFLRMDKGFSRLNMILISKQKSFSVV